MTKLHVCCGEVYLKNYINIDIQGFVRKENLWKDCNETTLDKYYIKPFNYEPKDSRANFVIDERVNILLPWRWEDGSVDEAVMIQAMEHFTYYDGKYIVKEIYRVLKPGGKFIFDFPDLIKTVESYKDDFDRLVRMIYCHYRDVFAAHKIAYNEETFARLLKSVGNWFSIEFKEVVKHDYPVIGGIATK
jgi:predicted SAM-dependent methyltransferase